MSQLKQKNAEVLGISADTVESHKRFVEKEHLNFSLLADTEKKMMTAYGVLGPNGFANRVTFVIGEDGRIRQIDRAVNAQFSREGGTLTTRHGTNLDLLLSDWKATIGQPVPNFSVADTEGKTVSLLQPGKKATVVLFLGAKSSVSRAYEDRIYRIASGPALPDVPNTPPAYANIAFLALYPNSNETPAEIQAAAKRALFRFPICRDEDNRIADHFHAAVTPTVWVINAKGVAVYSGSIDDNADPTRVKVSYLKKALDAILAEKPIENADTKANGNPIKRVRSGTK